MRRGIQRPRGVPTGPEFQRPIAPNPAQRSGPAGGPITAQNTLGRPNYGPPSNIGRDRAGGFGMNDLRQLFPEPTSPPGQPGGRMPPWGGPGRQGPRPSPLWPRPDRQMPRPSYPPSYPNPRLPYPMPDREYPNPRLPYPLEEREYQPAMDYMEEDMSYMSPNPFPFPGQPRPPIGRPPWGEFDETDWVGQPGGGDGESEFAASDEYRMWNSIRRKYGADVANQMMGGNVAANRGGIMGLI